MTYFRMNLLFLVCFKEAAPLVHGSEARVPDCFRNRRVGVFSMSAGRREGGAWEQVESFPVYEAAPVEFTSPEMQALA